MANLDAQNRSPKVEVLPDFRLRVTDRFDVLDYLPRDSVSFVANIQLPWGTPHPTYPQCRLVHQPTSGQIENDFRKPSDPPPNLLRVYEEIPANDRVIVGEPGISHDQYNRKTVIIEYVQFSDGTTTYTDVVGTTPAPSPNAECLLQTVEAPNDGTLIRWKLTFIDSGELSDNERLLFGGRLLIREITSLGVPPSTPAGYTLTTQSTEYIMGRQVYKYGFVNANAAGILGNGIGLGIEYGQSITEGVTTGTTTTTIRQISDLTVVSNPITTPSGQVLIRINYEDDAGYRLWTGVYAKAVVGTVDIQTEGREDGSLVYDITALGMAVAIPAYPGSGTGYNTSKSSVIRDGFYVNRATWVKPPPDTTYRQQQEFKMPGLAYFVGTDLILQPGAVMQLLGSLAVTFATSQVTTDPFYVKQWAGFIETYIPVGGSAVNNQFGLNGYLATGNSSSGTGLYKGVDCSSWSYQRFASDPVALPSGTIVVGVRNDPYLTDVNGTIVFKRSVMSVAIPP